MWRRSRRFVPENRKEDVPRPRTWAGGIPQTPTSRAGPRRTRIADHVRFLVRTHHFPRRSEQPDHPMSAAHWLPLAAERDIVRAAVLTTYRVTGASIAPFVPEGITL